MSVSREARELLGWACSRVRGGDVLGALAVCVSLAVALVGAQGAMGAKVHAPKARTHAPKALAHAPKAFEEFPVPAQKGQPDRITAGPDGNLWFTEGAANEIGRITPSGRISQFPIPTANSAPDGIAAGPDGNLWFTERAANQIGRITPSGSDQPVPDPHSEQYPGRDRRGP